MTNSRPRRRPRSYNHLLGVIRCFFAWMIVQERLANGAFESLVALCRRVDSRKVTRRVYEALIRSGALDRLGENRASLMQQLPEALKSRASSIASTQAVM